ncbi:MAG: anthranilate phosphoribosyltransferase, partial [Gammaproteobacteria bacterium]|nr:anthranilate phosphoribosyltransferase [Gammaproteobacteria bacterium]
MEMSETLAKLAAGVDLDSDEMTELMQSIMTGEATPAQIGSALTALRIKGETVEEITAAARVMRDLSSKVPVFHDEMIDTCGTGGSGVNKFNVSTASAIVIASAGLKVAKHGNRAASGVSGSADVLEAAGLRLDMSPEAVAASIEEVGVGFLFAVNHHSAMKHAIGPRREL